VPETGANVDLPMTIFVKDVGPTGQGYGRRFVTADGRAMSDRTTVIKKDHDDGTRSKTVIHDHD